jgi:hypothetical protein
VQPDPAAKRDRFTLAASLNVVKDAQAALGTAATDHPPDPTAPGNQGGNDAASQ